MSFYFLYRGTEDYHIKHHLTLFLAILTVSLPVCLHTDELEGENNDNIPLKTVNLYTERGTSLLSPEAEFYQLKENYVLQYKMHCGAASAVCVLNTLIPDAGFTQDNLFSAETASIITQDIVYEEGFTLEELAALLEVKSGLKINFFHAGQEENEHSCTEFLHHLEINRDNPHSKIIVCYSREYISGTGTARGHFSPVADYNQDANIVLLLEVGGIKDSYWIDAHDLFNAMNTIDTSCNMHRGWIIVKE